MEDKGIEVNAEELLKNMTPNIIASAIIILIALLIILITKRIVAGIKKSDGVMHSESGNKVANIVEKIIRVLVIVGALFLVLEVNGVSISALVASLGLIGAAATLAAQDVMKDIINGMYISGEKMYAAGDYIKYRDLEGLVLEFSLRSTKIELIPSRSIMYISNRNISEIIVISNKNRVSVPMPYELPLEKAERIMADVIEELKKDERIEDVKYDGVGALNDSSVDYDIVFFCSPDVRGNVKRHISRVFTIELAKNGESVPYNKLEIINVTSDKG